MGSFCPLCVPNGAEPAAAAHTAANCEKCGCDIGRVTGLLCEFQGRAARQLQIAPELVTPQTSLHELPVDSLGLVEFVTELERDYHVNLLERAWSEEVTYGDVVRLIIEKQPPTPS